MNYQWTINRQFDCSSLKDRIGGVARSPCPSPRSGREGARLADEPIETFRLGDKNDQPHSQLDRCWHSSWRERPQRARRDLLKKAHGLAKEPGASGKGSSSVEAARERNPTQEQDSKPWRRKRDDLRARRENLPRLSGWEEFAPACRGHSEQEAPSGKRCQSKGVGPQTLVDRHVGLEGRGK